jgi:hypothetical protein
VRSGFARRVVGVMAELQVDCHPERSSVRPFTTPEAPASARRFAIAYRCSSLKALNPVTNGSSSIQRYFNFLLSVGSSGPGRFASRLPGGLFAGRWVAAAARRGGPAAGDDLPPLELRLGGLPPRYSALLHGKPVGFLNSVVVDLQGNRAGAREA